MMSRPQGQHRTPVVLGTERDVERKGVTEGSPGGRRSLSATQAELLHHIRAGQLTSFSASLRVSQDPDPWSLLAPNSECTGLTSRTEQEDGAYVWFCPLGKGADGWSAHLALYQHNIEAGSSPPPLYKRVRLAGCVPRGLRRRAGLRGPGGPAPPLAALLVKSL